ncbi:MAG: TIGR02996 domain-containing protein, partial [Gemmataceae bacterium]|nr:TIGR02996 domain-containing protein [Gemmataceae bacterium]
MTHDAFLEAILADPHDDAHRLVYADWLEENGDEARARFIRLQCRAEG